jgi:hypothetical protein
MNRSALIGGFFLLGRETMLLEGFLGLAKFKLVLPGMIAGRALVPASTLNKGSLREIGETPVAVFLFWL